MQTTYKFRLYPNKEQEEKLLWTLNKCRFVYNKLLEGLNNQKKINRSELQHSIVELKKEYPELNQVYSKVLQYENYRLFSNLRALSRVKKKGKKVGKLRFKGLQWFKTFTYNQFGFKLADKLYLSKIGEISIKKHRIPQGSIKQITIKHTLSGKWYAMINCEIKNVSQKAANTKEVGIDLGIINYAYDSDGNHFDNPKNLDNSLKQLAKVQRKLSRKKRGSKNKEKQRIKVARKYEKILNQRNDFLHKLSNYYVSKYCLIAVEDLDVKGLINITYNAKSIMDASWNKFIQMLEYKAESAGVQVIKVDPRGTTQECSNCGVIVPKKLWNRKHKCMCGLDVDRDYNSSLEILNRATAGPVGSYACGD